MYLYIILIKRTNEKTTVIYQLKSRQIINFINQRKKKLLQ